MRSVRGVECSAVWCVCHVAHVRVFCRRKGRQAAAIMKDVWRSTIVADEWESESGGSSM